MTAGSSYQPCYCSIKTSANNQTIHLIRRFLCWTGSSTNLNLLGYRNPNGRVVFIEDERFRIPTINNNKLN